MIPPPPGSTLFPYTTLFRSPLLAPVGGALDHLPEPGARLGSVQPVRVGRRSLDERSEEHTSELQSHVNLVCRLLLEKKNLSTPPDSRYTHISAPPVNIPRAA